MRAFAKEIITAAAVTAGMDVDSIMDKPDKQNLLLPTPRLELEYMPEDYKRSFRRIAKACYPAVQEVAGEVLDTGNGILTVFSGTLDNRPIEPGTMVITDGVESFSDDGLGILTGSAGGAGTVDYETGAVAVTFHTAVVTDRDITTDYVTSMAGVPITHHIFRAQVYQHTLSVRAEVRTDDEIWLETFVREFILAMPHKTADSSNNLVVIRTVRAVRGGFESKLVEVFKKRSNALHIEFTGMLCREDQLPMIRDVNIIDGVTAA